MKLSYALCSLCSSHALEGEGQNMNYFLTVIEGRTREYGPEVVAVRTERSEVHTKMTQYHPVRLEQARLVSSLLDDTRVMVVY